VIPFLVSVLLVIGFQKPLTPEAITVLVPAFSVFTALLLNVAFLLLNTTVKMGADLRDEKSLTGTLVKNLYVNSLYAILISILILTILILVAICEPWLAADYQLNLVLVSVTVSPHLILMGISFAEYFLIVHFIMNLLMVTKRLHALLLIHMGLDESSSVSESGS